MAISLLVAALTSGCSDTAADAAKHASEAEAHLAQNQIPQARMAIRESILARDDVSEYHLLRGRIEYAAGSFEGAYTAYSDALALNPTNQEALQAVSQIGLQVGRYSESVDATNKLLVLNPNQTDALLIRGLHALIKRDFVGALANADKILSIDRFNEGGVVLKARASFLSGDRAAAASVLDNFEKFRPNTQAVAMTRLEIYRALGDSSKMEEQYRDLAQLRPGDLDIRLDKANFFYKTGRGTEATTLTASVLADDKASKDNVTTALKLWTEYAVTEISAQQAEAISSAGAPAARIAGARHFIDHGNPRIADFLLKGMVGADAEAERANLALLTGTKVLADSLSKEILATDATHCSALKAQAGVALANRQENQALRSAQAASSECPDQASLWLLTAKIYSKLGDEENVRRVFRQGIEANKQNQSLARAYSNWLLAQGNTREALAVARKITRSAPALTSGWRHYAEICSKAQASCSNEAQQGVKASQSRYGIDLQPGELPPNGLFGQFAGR